jgi:tRNA A37 methylthiotransferase MiaB
MGINKPAMAKKVFVDSSDLVCKPNAASTSRVADYVTENGCAITTDVGEADVIVVNTCGFTKWCEIETSNIIREHFRRKKQDAKVVSIGCLNVINRQMLESSFPELVIVEDFGKLDDLIGAAVAYEDFKHSAYDLKLLDIVKDRYQHPLLKNWSVWGAKLLERLTRRSTSEKVKQLHIPQVIEEIDRTKKTFVLIGRGCRNRCSYCIIKKAQGEPKSRRPEDIITDIRSKYTDKHAFVLVADDCASYGVDIGETFLGLVDRIVAAFPGIRIDIGYINPVWFHRQADDYIAMFATGRINNVNISLQSGSDRIIGKMNRKYTVDYLLDFIDRVKDVSPGTMIWTHAIVGFPSETWRDFQETLRALDHFHYYNVYVFSPREGTPAAEMGDRIPALIAEIRARVAYARLMQRVGFTVIKSWLGLR